MPERAVHYGDLQDDTRTACGILMDQGEWNERCSWNMDLVTCKRCLSAWAKWHRENP